MLIDCNYFITLAIVRVHMIILEKQKRNKNKNKNKKKESYINE